MFVSTRKLNVFLQPIVQAVRNGVNLTVRLDEKSSLGWIARLMKDLLDRFHAALIKIASTTIQLSHQAPELAQLSKQLEERAHLQQTHAENIAAASRTLAETVQSISNSASEASAFSQQVADAANNANLNDQQSRKQIQAIGESTQALEEQMTLLKTSSSSISEVVELIKNIADRTRLLSLNAAIEAARAGEQGRGFAVVADEVRKLADQTMTATQTVEELLETIQQQVTSSSDTMVAMASQVHQGINVSQAAGASLEAASRDITTLVESVRAIANASGAQNDKVNDITSQISSVAESTRQQLEDAKALARRASLVSEKCDVLLTEVGEFRFEGHQRVRQEVEGAITQWQLRRLDRSDLESKLAALCKRLPALELSYVVNSSGRQVTGDVTATGLDAGSVDFDCSGRRWFQEATRQKELYISDIYRSVVTGNYGFTVAAPLFDPSGQLLGVLGADMRFDHIIEG
jgi:methyl-accepting chemotaxis protein